jgi:ribose transport system permease protein
MQSPTFIARMGQRFSTELTLAAILVLLLLVLSWVSPVFWSDQNLANIVKQSAINGILAVGMTIIIISGGIDLSVGAVACLSGMVAAMLMTQGWSVGVSCAVALVASVLVGVINGILIYEGDIPPFIATLGTLTMVRGLVKLLTDARSVSGLPEGFFGIWPSRVAGRAFAVCGVDGLVCTHGMAAERYPLGAQCVCHWL